MGAIRNKFTRDIFREIYPLFIDELLGYDEVAGETPPKLSDVYRNAFLNAARAAYEATDIISDIAPFD